MSTGDIVRLNVREKCDGVRFTSAHNWVTLIGSVILRSMYSWIRCTCQASIESVLTVCSPRFGSGEFVRSGAVNQ